MMCLGKTLGSKTKRKLVTIRDNIPTQYVKMRRRRIHDTKIVTTCQNEKFKVEEKNEQGRKKKKKKKRCVNFVDSNHGQKKMSSEVTKMNNAHAVSKDKIL